MKRHIPPFIVLYLFTISAQGAVYATRTDFTNNSPPLATESFDTLVPGKFANNYPNGGTGFYTSLQTGILLLDLVRYLGSGDFGYETYILGNDVAAGAYTLDGSFALTGGRTVSTVFFPAGVTAFGTDFGAVGGATGGQLKVKVTLNDNTTELTTLQVSQRSQFFGYYNSQGIKEIELNSGGSGYYPYTLLDNVAIGGPAVVPEPSTFGLVVSSLLGFLCLSRRRRARVMPGRNDSPKAVN